MTGGYIMHIEQVFEIDDIAAAAQLMGGFSNETQSSIESSCGTILASEAEVLLP
jgi:hypothetical protein